MSAVIYVAVWSGDLKCIHNLLYLAGSANVPCYHSVIQYSFAAYELKGMTSVFGYQVFRSHSIGKPGSWN